MLEDPEQNIVYIPVSKELLAGIGEWSAPVRVRFDGKELTFMAVVPDARARVIERALEDMVGILGCGGDEKFTPASDPMQDLDREALAVANIALNYSG